MDHFQYQDGVLFAEQCDLRNIARQFGTPCYVYSRATLEHHYQVFSDGFSERDHLICYSVKANSNIAVLQVLSRLGAGFDIVSGGELQRVVAAGGDPTKVVFSGIAKTKIEMTLALQHGIHCFNVESIPELDLLNEVAKQLGVQAPIAIRVNPDVDAKTHPYIATGLKQNKFGIDIQVASQIYDYANKQSNIDIIGVACHIGSQLTLVDPFVDAVKRVLRLCQALSENGINIQEIDIGGGLGIPYGDESPPLPKDYAHALATLLRGHKYKLLLEPGRVIAGNAGILLTQVEYVKKTEHKNFAIVDAGMNDLVRPALYAAWQQIIPVEQQDFESLEYDVVGPICETGDFLGKDRSLAIDAHSLLAVRSSGAYGFVMSSNYNTRVRPPEIMVDGDQAHLIRRRETIADILDKESLLPNPDKPEPKNNLTG